MTVVLEPPPPPEKPTLLPALPRTGGPLNITSITLNGVALDLHDVLADVTIRHGRTGYYDAASPSTCTITLLGVDRAFTRPFQLGALLVVNATDGTAVRPAFTGRLTDADLELDTLTAIAVGRLRTLSGYPVGPGSYPEERWSYRVQRLFQDAGLSSASLLDNGDFETNIAGWSANGDAPGLTATRYTGWSRRGGASLRVLSTGGAPGSNYGGAYHPGGMPVAPGQTVTTTLTLKTFVTSPYFYVRLVIYLTGGGAEYYYSPSYPGAAGQEQQIVSVSTVMPALASQVDLYLFSYSNNAGQIDWAVDDVQVRLSSSPAVLKLEPGPFDPLLVEKTFTEQSTVAAYLAELAEDVQAAVADLPDGRILVQAIGSRTLTTATPLDPAEVAYAPNWQQRLPGANIVAVTYGDPEASVSVTDSASVAIYGPIRADYQTTIKSSTDATTMANNRLARDAYARWTIPMCALLYGRRFGVGEALWLTELPPAAPFDPWAPILEGWTDRIVSDGDELTWTMELALSDPSLSGLGLLAWSDVTSTLHWNTIDPTVAWRDALSLDDLTP